jgi:UDP-N-acetylmuramate dehydrogenase
MFQKNISLKNYTTFKIGGRAKYFFEAQNTKDIIKAVKAAKQLGIPIFILGGGSKVLISDQGFKGLIIKITGINFGRSVADSIKKGLTGLEWAIGIPGTIAGAVHGNTGAFGHSISEVVKSVMVLNPDNLRIKKYSNKQCGFSYRESIFKHNNEIILSAELKLKKGNPKKSLAIIKEYLKRRQERIPALPSAGCVFKNPKPLAAGQLIEQCGLKGKKIGRAQISEKHANIIVNLNKAKARDIFALINLAKKQVQKKFGIILAEEIIRL